MERTTWEIQPSEYKDKYDLIEGIYNTIRDLVIEDGNREIVLVTKIILGVFGIVPAFDEYFCKCFKKIEPEKSKFAALTLNKESLEVIQSFYLQNKKEIDGVSDETFTKDFTSGESVFNYPKAKIIDMYGFVIGTKE